MPKTSIRKVLLRRLGHVLRAWGEMLLRRSDQGMAFRQHRQVPTLGRPETRSKSPTTDRPAFSPMAQAEVADDGVDSRPPTQRPGNPPAHWLERVQPGGPPAHWLELAERSRNDVPIGTGEATDDARAAPPSATRASEHYRQGAMPRVPTSPSQQPDRVSTGRPVLRRDPSRVLRRLSSVGASLGPRRARTPGPDHGATLPKAASRPRSTVGPPPASRWRALIRQPKVWIQAGRRDSARTANTSKPLPGRGKRMEYGHLKHVRRGRVPTVAAHPGNMQDGTGQQNAAGEAPVLSRKWFVPPYSPAGPPAKTRTRRGEPWTPKRRPIRQAIRPSTLTEAESRVGPDGPRQYAPSGIPLGHDGHTRKNGGSVAELPRSSLERRREERPSGTRRDQWHRTTSSIRPDGSTIRSSRGGEGRQPIGPNENQVGASQRRNTIDRSRMTASHSLMISNKELTDPWPVLPDSPVPGDGTAAEEDWEAAYLLLEHRKRLDDEQKGVRWSA